MPVDVEFVEQLEFVNYREIKCAKCDGTGKIMAGCVALYCEKCQGKGSKLTAVSVTRANGTEEPL
jgi:DnaJ-class molecular chaperone